ncbi:MAG TPA: hypothetical protein VMM93_00125 [Vicinamibacterales bacterium]|nr:hypothetical protein [Vicinamibacterales bacterium]
MTTDLRDHGDRLHRALRRLPCPRAPHTLLPRVLAAIARPWYAREWLAWPLRWQVASLALAVLMVTAGWLVVTTSPQVTALTASADTAAAAARVLWRLLVQPVFAYVLVLSTLACLTCAAGWAALSRLDLTGVPR